MGQNAFSRFNLLGNLLYTVYLWVNTSRGYTKIQGSFEEAKITKNSSNKDYAFWTELEFLSEAVEQPKAQFLLFLTKELEPTSVHIQNII